MRECRWKAMLATVAMAVPLCTAEEGGSRTASELTRECYSHLWGFRSQISLIYTAYYHLMSIVYPAIKKGVYSLIVMIVDITWGFILAHCIANKAVECSGEKTFLQKQEFNYTQGSRRLLQYPVWHGKEDQSRRLTLARVLTNKVACFPSSWDAQKLSLEMQISHSVQFVPFSTCARKKNLDITGIPRAARMELILYKTYLLTYVWQVLFNIPSLSRLFLLLVVLVDEVLE
jgi:hypothetical protein